MGDSDKINHIFDRTTQFILEGHNFNMSDLARDLNISRKTLYNHVRSRKNLLQCTLDYFFEQMGSELEEKIMEDLPFLERGEMLIKQLADRIDQIERLCSQKVFVDQQVETQYKRVYASIKEKMVTFIEEGQTLGWIRPEMSPVQVADLYFTLIIGSLHYQGSNESYMTYIIMIIQGLISEEAREKTGDEVRNKGPFSLSGTEKPHLPGINF